MSKILSSQSLSVPPVALAQVVVTKNVTLQRGRWKLWCPRWCQHNQNVKWIKIHGVFKSSGSMRNNLHLEWYHQPKLSALQTWDSKLYCSTNNFSEYILLLNIVRHVDAKCSKYPCANKLNGCRKTSFHIHELGLKIPVLHTHGRYQTRKRKGKGSICKMKYRKLQWSNNMSGLQLIDSVSQCNLRQHLPVNPYCWWKKSG